MLASFTEIANFYGASISNLPNSYALSYCTFEGVCSAGTGSESYSQLSQISQVTENSPLIFWTFSVSSIHTHTHTHTFKHSCQSYNCICFLAYTHCIDRQEHDQIVRELATSSTDGIIWKKHIVSEAFSEKDMLK